MSRNPIRVLTVIESLGRGGAERLVVDTHQHIRSDAFETKVVCLYSPNPLAAELDGTDTEVIALDLPGPNALPAAIQKLRRLVGSFEPHVVHTHLFGANVAGRIASGRHARVVTTLHNPDYSADRGTGWRFAVRTQLDRTTGNVAADRFLAVSRHVRDDFRDRMGFQNIQVLPNWTDVHQITARATAIDRHDVRRELGLSDETVVVTHVGRLHRQKAQDVLIRSFMSLVEHGTDAVLLLAGDGSEYAALRALADEGSAPDRVRMLGALPDVVPVLVASDVFAFPSRFEAFGIALLEAMALGLPSVVTRIGGIPEVTDSEASLFVPVEDEVALEVALGRLCREPTLRRELGEAARKRSLGFDVRAGVSRLESIYEEEARASGWSGEIGDGSR